MTNELDPKCLDKRQAAFGFTNRGEVIPCCWLDTSRNDPDPDYQRLLKVSRIEDYDSVEEIFLNPEWIEFVKNLKEGKGFRFCHTVCKKRDKPQHKAHIFENKESWT